MATGDPREIAPVVEALGAAETRMSFRVGDSWCRTASVDLRSGIRLGVTTLEFERSFSFLAPQPPSEIDLVVSKGIVLHARTPDGQYVQRGGTSLQLGRSTPALPLQIRPEDDGAMECVSLSMRESILCDLLGVASLPDAFWGSSGREAAAEVSYAMTPELFLLLEEIVNVDAKGKSRLLWYEAKSLELVARMTDELAEAARSELHPLSPHDVDCLERVRRVLVEHLDAPPTIAKLARTVAFSETKLKVGFRRLFGTSVFAYLRQVRMEEARRLLLEHRLNVTEIAQRVGYSNPSKFAAAFRRRFGMSPSAL
jgi:AraC-like DNA-binding protein